ncbi:MAG: preprotein translocase subunit YajC [Saezia sp.]
MNLAILAANAQGGSTWTFILMIVVLALALYFLMWRPQKKKEKKASDMRNSLDVGDEVTTIGGIVGRVVSLKEDTFVIETAGDRSRMRFKRWAIQEVGKLSMEEDGDSSIKSVKTESGSSADNTETEKKPFWRR